MDGQSVSQSLSKVSKGRSSPPWSNKNHNKSAYRDVVAGLKIIS